MDGGSTSAAHLELSGGYLGYASMNSEPGTDMTDNFKSGFQWSVPSFDIIDNETASDEITCGTVTVDVNNIKYITSNKGLDIYLGAKLTLANTNIDMSKGVLTCRGDTTATVVYGEYSIEE